MTSLGMNSSMSPTVRFDMFKVQFWVQMFGRVQRFVLLVCDQTSLGTYSLMFANCSAFCDV